MMNEKLSLKSKGVLIYLRTPFYFTGVQVPFLEIVNTLFQKFKKNFRAETLPRRCAARCPVRRSVPQADNPSHPSSTPPISMVPLSTGNTPATALSIVDLPAPLPPRCRTARRSNRQPAPTASRLLKCPEMKRSGASATSVWRTTCARSPDTARATPR